MKVFPDRLPSTLERGLAPVYLVAGPERLLVEEAADQIRAAARGQQIDERIRLGAGGRFDWNELAQSTATASLFASRRLVEVRLATGKPGKDGGAAIRGWTDQQRDDVLLLLFDQWEIAQERSAWFKAVDQVGVFVPCWAVKPDQLPRWIGARLQRRGLNGDAAACRFLAERLEGNLLAAAQEVDRLALLYPGATLDEAKLEQAVADNARFDAFRLTELVLAGQAGAALRCIRGLRETEVAPPAILWALGRELEIALAVARRSAHQSIARVFSELQVWKARQEPIQRCVNRLGSAALERAVMSLSRLDQLAKGQAFGDFWIELERLCVAVAQPARRAA